MGRLQEKNKTQAPVTPTQTPGQIKQPSTKSKVAGVVGRATEVSQALFSNPVLMARQLWNLAGSGTKEEFMKSSAERGRQLWNIPSEIKQGWEEGFGATSDIPTMSESLGLDKSSILGVGIDIATDILTPGGQGKVGMKISKKILGSTGTRIASKLSGVVKPVGRTFKQWSTMSGKAGDLEKELTKLTKVDFTETVEEAKRVAQGIGKTFRGAGETLSQKAVKYNIPTDDWIKAKTYIDGAKETAAKKIEEATRIIGKLDYQDVSDDIGRWINDKSMIKGSKWAGAMKKKANIMLSNLVDGSGETGYKMRNLIENELNNSQKLVKIGAKKIDDMDELYDVFSKSLRTKLNKFKPLNTAQEAYTDLSLLGKKATGKIQELLANKDKIHKLAVEALEEDATKFAESQRVAWEAFQNRMNAGTWQKIGADILGKAVSNIPGEVLPFIERAKNIMAKPKEK